MDVHQSVSASNERLAHTIHTLKRQIVLLECALTAVENNSPVATKELISRTLNSITAELNYLTAGTEPAPK